MGAMMGAGVGLTIGFIFGSFSILRFVHIVLERVPCFTWVFPPPFISLCILVVTERISHTMRMMNRGGAGPRGALPTLSQYMLSSAATFGFFLAIGSVGISSYLFNRPHQ